MIKRVANDAQCVTILDKLDTAIQAAPNCVWPPGYIPRVGQCEGAWDVRALAPVQQAFCDVWRHANEASVKSPSDLISSMDTVIDLLQEGQGG